MLTTHLRCRRQLVEKCLFFIIIAVCVATTISSAQVPKLISHQGFLADSTGQPLDTLVSMTVSIFADSTGGTPLLTQTNASTQINQGTYNFLVDVSSLSFTSPYWLEVEVNTEVLSPRTKIVSVPYSLYTPKADTAQILSNVTGTSKILMGDAFSPNVITFVVNGENHWLMEGTRLSPLSSGNNLFIGMNAGQGHTLTSNGNTYIGNEAGYSSIDGIENTFVGHRAGHSNGSGLKNTFVGSRAGSGNNSGNNNSFFGENAGFSNLVGNDNAFFGQTAGYNNQASNNSFFGQDAGYSNTGGTNNSFFGKSAGRTNSDGNYNSAFGYQSLYSNLTGSSNHASGYQSLYNNTTGTLNTAGGFGALLSNTIGNENTAEGANALYSNTTGSRNTAIGKDALLTQSYDPGFAWLSENVALGYRALYSNQPTTTTNGFRNTALGASSLFSNITGSSNTATGHKALYTNQSGLANTANGTLSLYSNTDGIENTAVGKSALYTNTSGDSNTASGVNSLYSNDAGSKNTAHGFASLYSNTSGDENVAIGFQSLSNNTTASTAVAIGAHAMRYFIGTGQCINVAVGYEALRGSELFSTTGSANVAVGSKSLLYNTSGHSNTAVGYRAMSSNNAGIYNTAFGRQALENNETGSYNTSVGYNSGTVGSSNENTSSIGFLTQTTADNSVRVGNGSVISIGGQVGWTTLSDASIKTDIQENIPGLAFIKELRPVSYHYDVDKQNELMGVMDTARWRGKDDIRKIAFSGFLAQEVEAAAHKIGYEFSGVDAPQNENSLYGLRYAEFVVPLVKAVQELNAINEHLQSKVVALEKENFALNAQLSNLTSDVRVEIDNLKTLVRRMNESSSVHLTMNAEK